MSKRTLPTSDRELASSVPPYVCLGATAALAPNGPSNPFLPQPFTVGELEARCQACAKAGGFAVRVECLEVRHSDVSGIEFRTTSHTFIGDSRLRNKTYKFLSRRSSASQDELFRDPAGVAIRDDLESLRELWGGSLGPVMRYAPGSTEGLRCPEFLLEGLPVGGCYRTVVDFEIHTASTLDSLRRDGVVRFMPHSPGPHRRSTRRLKRAQNVRVVTVPTPDGASMASDALGEVPELASETLPSVPEAALASEGRQAELRDHLAPQPPNGLDPDPSVAMQQLYQKLNKEHPAAGLRQELREYLVWMCERPKSEGSLFASAEHVTEFGARLLTVVPQVRGELVLWVKPTGASEPSGHRVSRVTGMDPAFTNPRISVSASGNKSATMETWPPATRIELRDPPANI